MIALKSNLFPARKSAVRILLAGIFFCASASALKAQVYTFTSLVSGYAEIALEDVGGQSAPYSGTPGYASTSVNFGTLTETVYLNQAAQTIRQVGTLSLSASTANLSFNSFGYGSGATPATINATLSLGNSGSLSFDTGPVSYSLVGGAFSAQTSLTLPVSGSYSLTTGGQTYTGNLQYNQVETSWAATFGSLTATSMQISQSASASELGSVQATLAAANAYTMRLENGANDGSSYFSYSMGPVTAESMPSPVPEPSTCWLFGLGLAGLFAIHRLRTRNPVRAQAEQR